MLVVSAWPPASVLKLLSVALAVLLPIVGWPASVLAESVFSVTVLAVSIGEAGREHGP